MGSMKKNNRLRAYERDAYDPDAPEILRTGRDSDLDALTKGLSADHIRQRKAQGGQAARGVLGVVVALVIAAIAVFLFVSRQGA